MSRRWLSLPLHPFLFGLLPLAAQLSFNLGQVQFDEVLRPALIVLAFSGIMLVALRWITGDLSLSAVLLSLGNNLIFAYGHLFTLLLVGLHFLGRNLGATWEGMPLALTTHAILSILLLAFMMAFYRLLARKESWWRPTGLFLNAVVLVALTLPAVRIATYYGGGAAQPTPSPAPDSLWIEAAPGDEDFPDIYYIVLDGYARADVLQREFGLENSEFLEDLQGLGFWVAQESRSNYSQTVLSQGSTLNMAYLPELLGEYDPTAQHQETTGLLTPLIRWSRVRRLLESQGYRFEAFSTGYWPTDIVDADIYHAPDYHGVSGFESLVVRTTALAMVEDAASTLRLPYPYSGYEGHRERIQFAFDRLPGLAASRGPKFVYIHLLVPHPPFVFGKDGSPVEPRYRYTLGDASDFPLDREDYIAGYVDQVHFVNKRLREVLPALVAESPQDAIILIQADHGSASQLEWDSPSASAIEERMAILNAYRIPGLDERELYPEISPVNSFRLIFNELFGADYPLLTDKSYYSGTTHPFGWRRVP